MVETQKNIEANKKMYLTWSLHDHDVRKHGREEGIRIGEKRGEKRGQEQNKIENARNLLVMGLGTHEQISQAVGLPLEKITEISAELAKEVQ